VKREVCEILSVIQGNTLASEAGSFPSGTRLPCPSCRQECDLIERIRKPVTSPLLPDQPGGPLRDVGVTEADGTAATWKASYYYFAALRDMDTAGSPYGAADTELTIMGCHMATAIARRAIAERFPKTADAASLEAFRWDGEAERLRAQLRQNEAKITACAESLKQMTGEEIRSVKPQKPCVFAEGSNVWVSGLVNRPEYNGLDGKVTAILPFHTDENKTDTVRHRVALSVGGIVLSLRGDTLHPDPGLPTALQGHKPSR